MPFSAGSTIDVVGRVVLDPLALQLGQTIVIDIGGGAGGSIGSAVVAKAEPDGYTLLINASCSFRSTCRLSTFVVRSI